MSRNKAKGPNDLVMPSVKIKEGLRRQLKAAAIKNHRSLMGEINHRLEQSVLKPKQLERAE